MRHVTPRGALGRIGSNIYGGSRDLWARMPAPSRRATPNVNAARCHAQRRLHSSIRFIIGRARPATKLHRRGVPAGVWQVRPGQDGPGGAQCQFHSSRSMALGWPALQLGWRWACPAPGLAGSPPVVPPRPPAGARDQARGPPVTCSDMYMHIHMGGPPPGPPGAGPILLAFADVPPPHTPIGAMRRLACAPAMAWPYKPSATGNDPGLAHGTRRTKSGTLSLCSIILLNAHCCTSLGALTSLAHVQLSLV